MAYEVPIGAILAVTLDSRVKAQQMMTVLHYRLEAPIVYADGEVALDNIAERLNVDEGLVSRYMSCCSNSLTGLRLLLQWISPVRHAYRSYLPVDTSGTVASPCPSPNLAVAITKRTADSGRHERGTLHMPGVPNDFITNSEVNGAGFVKYADLITKLLEPITFLLSEFRAVPVLFRRSDPAIAPQFTSCSTKAQLRTMHRRTVGLGT